MIPFFFAIALFVYLFSFLYLFCSFLYFFSVLYFFIFFYSFQVYCKCSMQKIRNVSKTSPSLAVSVFEFITSLSTFPSLDVSV